VAAARESSITFAKSRLAALRARCKEAPEYVGDGVEAVLRGNRFSDVDRPVEYSGLHMTRLEISED
jgi:hypothetical protein